MSTEPLLKLQDFEADTDVPYIIQVGDILLTAPFFRWDGTHWIDATGDHDLCLSPDGMYLEFINRRPSKERFAYRYTSIFWLVNRLGVPNR